MVAGLAVQPQASYKMLTLLCSAGSNTHRAAVPTREKHIFQVVFESVAAHRFRDVADEVRTVVIGGIGRWIQLLPSEFLDDKYLKYIAWALSDKV